MKILESEQILRAHEALVTHPLYSKIKCQNTLKVFMETHVFAVWDFMSLLKGLQKDITCVSLPWRPSSYPKEIVRMINEIVLGEESDVDFNGDAMDHFTMYIKAMEEVGADTSKITNFINDFDTSNLQPSTKEFLEFNLSLANSGELHKIASAFFFGREKLIPDMFTSILKDFKSNGLDCPYLTYYLERHIELDGDEHSILAKKCLEALCTNEKEVLEAIEVGQKSLELRAKVWDEVLNNL